MPLVFQGRPHVGINVCRRSGNCGFKTIPITVFQRLITTYRRKRIQRQAADGLLKGEVSGGFELPACLQLFETRQNFKL